jgi:SET domain-containing protein|tara:strand:+ start:186 stop:518 length:333 start_codon:yes stop_codon:yes gene_type:complete
MFDIKDSNIEGQGVFASEHIKKDCIIGPAYELIGQVNSKYIAGDITILGLMHNHSTTPTARPEMYNNTIYFEAINNIKVGEEITCNYNEYSNVSNIERPLDKWQESNYEN